MRFVTACFIAANLIVFSGCSEKSPSRPYADVSQKQDARSQSPSNASSPASPPPAAPAIAADSAFSAALQTNIGGRAKQQNASFDEAAGAAANQQAIERKIIRNGKLTIETDSPTQGQQKITAIVEA